MDGVDIIDRGLLFHNPESATAKARSLLNLHYEQGTNSSTRSADLSDLEVE